MPEENSTNRGQRGKVELAAILTVVFIGVVVFQVKTHSASEPPAPQAKATKKSRSDKGPPSSRGLVPDESVAPSRPPRDWPQVDLAACIAHDPFLAPEGLALQRKLAASQHGTAETRQRDIEEAQKVAAQRRAISTLMESGVHAVFVGPDGPTALVGDQRLQVGDEIHGHRVIAIKPEGVVLEPIEHDPARP